MARIKVESDDSIFDETKPPSGQLSQTNGTNSNNNIHDMMMVDTVDENDEVVREIDVYLAPELTKYLYLLQYPLVPNATSSMEVGNNNNNNNNSTTNIPTTPIPAISAARIKPRHGMIEIDHPIPTTDCIERDGKFDFMERTYCSHTVPIQTHLCLGKLIVDDHDATRSSLHLVPLTHINQMRPSFKHVDEAAYDNNNEPTTTTTTTRSSARKMTDDTNNTTEPTNTTKAIIPLFKRKESERAQIARLNSYAYKKQSEESEEWFPLNVQEYESKQWYTAMKKMICTTPHTWNNLIKEGTNDATYMNSLNYLSLNNKCNATAGVGIGDGVQTTTTTSIQKTIVSQVVSMLYQGNQVPYQLLRAKFRSYIVSNNQNNDDSILLDALDVCCVLVRGNYTLQSKYMNIDPVLKPVRTFILLLLQEPSNEVDCIIDRTKLTYVFSKEHYNPTAIMGTTTHTTTTATTTGSTSRKTNNNTNTVCYITPEKIHAFLTSVAKPNHTITRNHPQYNGQKGWIPRIEDDTVFLQTHPNKQQLHQHYWNQQRIRFQKQLALYHNYNTNNATS